jgi:Clr5 domain
MDTFNAPRPAVLPAGFKFVKQTLFAEQSSQYGSILQDAPAVETTKQQWERLKPLIQKIYIEENKPFSYLAKILRDEHSFEPT